MASASRSPADKIYEPTRKLIRLSPFLYEPYKLQSRRIAAYWFGMLHQIGAWPPRIRKYTQERHQIMKAIRLHEYGGLDNVGFEEIPTMA